MGRLLQRSRRFSNWMPKVPFRNRPTLLTLPRMRRLLGIKLPSRARGGPRRRPLPGAASPRKKEKPEKTPRRAKRNPSWRDDSTLDRKTREEELPCRPILHVRDPAVKRAARLPPAPPLLPLVPLRRIQRRITLPRSAMGQESSSPVPEPASSFLPTPVPPTSPESILIKGERVDSAVCVWGGETD